MEKHVLSIFGVALALAAALPFAQGAIASLAASAGTYEADERAKEAGKDLADGARIAKGELYTAVLAENADIYKKVGKEDLSVPLNQGDLLLLFYDGLHGDRAESISVLFNNELYYAKESAFIPEGSDHPLFSRLFASEVEFYARARKNITVYSKAGSRSKWLGSIPSNGNFAVLGRSGDSYKIAYGDRAAYISAKSPVSKINRKAWEAALQRETDTQFVLGDWTYNGLLAEERKLLQTDAKVAYIALRLTNGEAISEVYYPDTATANGRAKSLMDKNELLISATTDEEVYEAFDPGAAYRFYRNENAIIYYDGKNSEVIAALEKAHGQPFYTLEG